MLYNDWINLVFVGLFLGIEREWEYIVGYNT